MRETHKVTGVSLRILYEDNHILAVNKMPSDIVQGDRTGDETLADRVRQYLRGAYGKTGNVFVGIPHRLDRPTSGVVIFARTDKSLERLSALFREGGVKKTYWAVVAERPPGESGRLVHWLKRNPVQNKSYAVAGPSGGHAQAAREARLTYRLLFSLERYHLLEIELETGRHHQIRAQLAAIGCHIKGDLKYGAARSNPGGGIHLHARQASFVHPVRKTPIVITADPPPDPVWDAVMERWQALPGNASVTGGRAAADTPTDSGV
jgi:23S rRNA pseudouridine1911/1915/1917 synthase